MRVRTPEPARLAQIVQHFGYVPRSAGPDTVLVEGPTPEQLGPILAANQVVVYGLSQEAQDLEHLFMDLTADTPGGPPGPPPPAPPGVLA
jgi:hypothetical protein